MSQVWMCSACHSLNDATAKRCYKCRTKRAVGELRDTSGAPNAPGLAATAPRDPSLVGGILGGLVVGIPVTAAWYWIAFHLVGNFFWLAWLVGAAIAMGVVIGGRGRTSFPLVLFSVLLTAAALAIGEYLIISQALALAHGVVATGIPVADPSDIADALPKLVGAQPWRPLLWVVALVTAWTIPWSRLVGRAPARGGVDR